MTAAVIGWLSAIGATLGLVLGLVLFATNCLKAANNLIGSNNKGGDRR